MATIAGLLAYCKQQARIEKIDYFDPRYPRPDEVAAWRKDCRRRDRARAYCFACFPARLSKGTEPLIPGKYERLIISPDGNPDYIVGQYAPVEIYDYLHWYLRQTNH